ncbi:hypothetical protein H7J83_08455 [Mycobacterium mantenii]|uniref:hypothetical protein n=1 Tax=Mycobacterium mantenii TaxID=560555 RepID=UPI001301C8AA|nr:hypothetical protein [Mycobacterium mantenii]MCV7242777.1 hypothetical protein [Mycobacterium mantenii]
MTSNVVRSRRRLERPAADRDSDAGRAGAAADGSAGMGRRVVGCWSIVTWGGA